MAEFNTLKSDINLKSYKNRKPVSNGTHCSVEGNHTLAHSDIHSTGIQVLGSWPFVYTWIMHDVAQHVIPFCLSGIIA